jgi:BASS family bile acid:Na+ symporter
MKLTTWMGVYGKILSLFAMMILGALFPQFQGFSFLIQYLLMVMLFLAFLDIELKPGSFHGGVFFLLIANVAVAYLGYWAFATSNITFALVAFLTGIAPSAIASPVIVSFVEGRVEYVISAVLLTNVAAALIVPFALPALVGADITISVWEVLQSALVVMFVPLVLAWLVSRLSSRAQVIVRGGRRYSFSIWLANLFLISAKAADFIRNENTGSVSILLSIALISLIVCVINFALGAWIGGRQYRQEASQALGQKNLTFVIWIALTYINPLVAMGPMFYILYHHLYNSWLIYRFEKGRA